MTGKLDKLRVLTFVLLGACFALAAAGFFVGPAYYRVLTFNMAGTALAASVVAAIRGRYTVAAMALLAVLFLFW